MKVAKRVAVLSTLALFALVTSTGCSTLHGSAIPTGALRLPPRSGAVAIYASSAPADGVELGVVDVRAYGEEGTVETLLPMFVQRVADLGGNAAVIDGVHARFDIVARPYVDTIYYSCGFGRICPQTRTMVFNDELMTVRMTGKAMLVGGAAAPANPPGGATERP